jgi:hypothetical protein
VPSLAAARAAAARNLLIFRGGAVEYSKTRLWAWSGRAAGDRSRNNESKKNGGYLMSALYYGDNLEVLRDRERFPDECVDLIYLDPPFNSQATYNVLFRSPTGEQSKAQIEAFEDLGIGTPLPSSPLMKSCAAAIRTPRKCSGPCGRS